MLKYSTSTSKNSTTTSSRSTTTTIVNIESETEPGELNRGDDTRIKLPQRFVVKYLGFRETTNLWGIKHTRNPVDEMVTQAKQFLTSDVTDSMIPLPPSLPLLSLEVMEDGIIVEPMPQNTSLSYPGGKFPIDSISYGVQDLVYTRVFAMIVVNRISNGQSNSVTRETESSTVHRPFQCHAFVTNSRDTAKRLTFALAEAFHRFSASICQKKKTINRSEVSKESNLVVNGRTHGTGDLDEGKLSVSLEEFRI